MDFILDFSRGVLAIAVLIGFCYLLSNDRKAIKWRLVVVGLALQVVLALAILRLPFVSTIFDGIAKGFQAILGFTKAGAEFLFANIVTDIDSFGYIFAFQVLPTVIFFSAFSSVLYYLGILQKIVYGLAWLMNRTMGLSGPESLAAAANVFIGQTEAPLVVKPFLENMTKSEMLCLMTGGMATIAGGVFAAYVGYLGGGDEARELFYAKHLLTASIISAPAAIVAAKILYPEDNEKDLEQQMQMTPDDSSNLLDAISRGTTDGLKLAVNVGAMLLVFTALIYMLNVMLMSSTDGVNFVANNYLGGTADWNGTIRAATDNRFEGLTFTYILGLVFAPIAWLLGTPSQDMLVIGQLLGQKTVINEFVAYAELNKLRESGVVLQDKSLLIATYALCGFSNFASIGIQIGGISALAPGQRRNLTELGIKALIGGTVACFLTAAIAGIIA